MDGLAGLAALVRRETGITLASSRETALRSALRRAAPGLGPDAFLREAADPVRGPAAVARLVDEVTTQETTFARDRRQFDAIDWPELLRQASAGGDTGIRAWSAGCATGEEPYTLALLATEAFAPVTVPVDVLGTDISGAALAAARTGHYRPRAVQGLDSVLRQRYLTRDRDGSYRVGGRLRGMVRFRRHNLIRDPIPPAGEAPFDLIVCRNVLIYFEPPVARRLMSAFERAVRPGGMLILGAVDSLCRYRPGSGHRPAPGPCRAPGARPVPGPRAGARQQAEPGTAQQAPATAGGPQRPAGRSAREERLTGALAAADRGDAEAALAEANLLLTEDPMDPDAHFVRGLVRLSAGDPAGAVDALRRALYSDAAFALAAFTLGRAHDELGDTTAARRAYRQALRTLDPDDERHEFMLQQVDIGDIAAACRARLGGEA
jgi:chemotaxis protein methyltransferase CheR